MKNNLIKNSKDSISCQETNLATCTFNIEELKQIAENEKTLRHIMQSSSSTFNFERIINSIVTEAGTFFKADRCFYIGIDTETMQHKPIEKYAEYLSSAEIKSHTTRQPKQEETAKFIKNAESDKIIFVDDISTATLPEEAKKMLIDDLSVKSYLIATVNYNNMIYGSIVLHYVKNLKTFTQADVNMIKTIARQAAIVIHQAKLYEAMQQTARRETILRKIIEITRKSIDITQVKKQIVNELGILFRADRCYFRSYDRLSDKFLPPDVEYLGSSKVQSLLNIEPNQEGIKYFSNELKKRVQGFYPVVANIEMAKGTPLEAYMKSSDIVADYAMPIIEDEKGFTWLVLHYSNTDPKLDDDYKKLLETIAFHVDTALHQAELYSKTQQQMEREKAILANLPFMAWLKDKKGRFLAVNEAFANNCNTSTEAMVGKTDLDFFPKDLAQSYLDDDMEVLTTGKPKHVEEEIIGVDGCHWHETYKTPVLDQNGKIVGTTGFARDITERKELDRIKNEFISTVSHELRTPLTSLSGSLELVLSGKMGDFSEKIKTLLNMAYSNCFRLTNLINDILDIEKIEAGKMDFDIKDLELMPIIKQAIQLNLNYAQKYNVEIKMIETLPDTFVKVDSGRLIQVITNLLSNAIKFSEPRTSVDLSAERINDNIRISVTNYGTEISQEFKSRIFQKFAQADSSDSRQKGGTGLGLNISKLIIEKMNGQINFVSENKKTTFYFDLPELIAEKEGV